jgi:hypothetical protein
MRPRPPAPPAGASRAPDHCGAALRVILAAMKQSPTQQLEEMHATLVRAITLLRNQEIVEAHRLLAVLQGKIEGALAEAQHGRWWR